MIDAGTVESVLTLNTNKFEASLKSAGEDLKGFVKSSETAGNRIKSLGSGMQNLGGTMTKYVTAPLIGAGLAMTSMAMDFETGMAQVSTIADTTKVSMDEISKGIIKMSNDTGIATKDLSTSLYDAISSGVDTAEALGFVEEATKLAKGGFTSTTKAIDILTTALNGYGLESKETTRINDVLIQTQNLGKTTVDQLSESMGKVIPVAASNNVSIEQLGAAYANLTAKGIATAEAGTYIRSMLAELSKTGSDADKALRELGGKSFAQLSSEGKSLSDILNMLNGHAKKNGLTLKDMFGSVEAGTAAMVLATNEGKDFNDALKQMQSSSGSAEKAFKTMSETTEEKFKKSLNQLKNDAMELGTILLPLASKIIDSISGIANWFSNLSDESKELIVKIGLLAATAGPLLSIGGKLTTGFGSLVNAGSKLIGVLSGASKATQAVGAASVVAEGGIAKVGLASKAATLLLNPWTLGITGVGVAAVALGKQLSKDVVPEVDLFAKAIKRSSQGVYEGSVEISEATKSAVSSYQDMDKEIQNILFSMKANGEVVTHDTANTLITKFNSMGKTITTELDNDYQKNLQVMQNFFSQSTTLTLEEQAEMQGLLTSHYEKQKITTEEGLIKITEIYTNASNQNRDTTLEEQAEIDRIRKEMQTTAITALSETEKESAVILGRIKEYDGRMTAEMASEHVKKLEEQRIKSIDQANIEYAEKMRLAEAIRAEGGAKAEESANKVIAEAEKQKNEVIAKANQTKTQGIDVLKASYDGLGREVSEETGKILSWWDKLLSHKYKPVTEGSIFYYSGSMPSSRPSNSGMGGYSVGTYSAGSGLKWVGENGPELVDFKGGEKVIPAIQSEKIAKEYTETSSKTNESRIDLTAINTIVKEMTYKIVEGINNRPIIVDQPINVDGRELARSVAQFPEEFDDYSFRTV